VHEQLAPRPQPPRHAAHQLLVVLHVLKHLDRHDAVVLAGGLGFIGGV
jgi:hypothetical protein